MKPIAWLPTAAVVFLLILALLGSPNATRAAVITVSVDCSLTDAINAANSGSAIGGCAMGATGPDTIVLGADVVLSRVDNTTREGANGLPVITSDITIRGSGFIIARADGSSVPDFRLFQIAPGATLRLESIILRNGRVVGADGLRGRNSTTPGTDGETGEMGSVGFVMSGPGGTGGMGGNGLPGGAGGSGGAASGGAIYNTGTLELIDTTLENNQVRGGNGGPGGSGSRGGVGGFGGSPGIPIPLFIFAILGPPGAGGAGGIGGTGGAGGSGGAAYGAAVYNNGGDVVIQASTFVGNQAFGGTAGAGGRGGAGGSGGPGALGQRGTLGPGGRGGRGGEGGRGGSGGASAGGALYSVGGNVAISLSQLGANRVVAGRSGAGGLAGQGADGGLDSGDGGLGGPGGMGGVSGAAQGGAILSMGGTLLVERSTLSNNSAQGGMGGTGNDAGSGGGGGASYFAPGAGIEEITQILILSMAGISVSGGPGGTGGDGGQGGNADGGAIYSATGSFTMVHSTLSGNAAEAGIGGLGGRGALEGISSALVDALELEGIIIRDASGNGAVGTSGDASGGALRSQDTDLTISRSTFTHNQAAIGGALRVETGERIVMITSSSIAGNTASARGGGLSSVDGTQIQSSIIAENSAPQAVDIDGTVDSLDHNLIGDTSGFTLNGPVARSILNSEAHLQALAKNGGQTETLALLGASPAINRGLCTDITDQRDFYRVDALCDIGAFELGASAQMPFPVPPPIAILADDDTVRAGLPSGVYGQIIASRGEFLRDPGEIGNQAVIDLGVIAAIDVFSLDNTSAAGATVCFEGQGRVIFLDALTAPRVARLLQATSTDGFACARLPNAGTVVLVKG